MFAEFDDIYIQEQYSEVKSRSDVNVGNYLNISEKSLYLPLPIISANMPQITESAMTACMFENGGIGILHRFCNIPTNINMIKKHCSILESKYKLDKDCINHSYGISIGSNVDDAIQRFSAGYKIGTRVFCLDVAFGNHIKVKETIKKIKKISNNDITLIVGNISTVEGAKNLIEWGADILKVGIGPGSHCSTRKRTGVGTPQLRALYDIKTKVPESILIADGGIRCTADIAKSLIFADFVMVGSVLAGTIETPGPVYPTADSDLRNRTYYKMYGGSTSAENKNNNGNKVKFVEGVSTQVPFKGHVKYILREIKEGLQSSFSYSNALNLKEFKKNVIWSDGINTYRGLEKIK